MFSERPRHLAPLALSFLNQGKVSGLIDTQVRSAEVPLYFKTYQSVQEYQKRIAFEKRCQQRESLCAQLIEVDLNNPIWGYGEEFFATLPQGKKAIWQLLKNWEVFQAQDDKLTPPSALKNSYPREFIDLDRETMIALITNHNNITPKEFLASPQLIAQYQSLLDQVELARQASLEQYDILKSGLLDVNGMPLLAKDYINALIEASEKLGGATVVPTGLSADEMKTYQSLSQKDGNSALLLGLNKGISPALLRSIRDQPTDLRAASYITKADVGQIPLVNSSCSMGMLYVWHHIPEDKKAAVLAEMLRVSGEMAGGGRALNIFEPLSSRGLLKMVLDTNWYLGHETAMFDAMVGTTICGGQTENSLAKELSELAPGVKWYTETLPSIPSALSDLILPQQQIRAAAYPI